MSYPTWTSSSTRRRSLRSDCKYAAVLKKLVCLCLLFFVPPLLLLPHNVRIHPLPHSTAFPHSTAVAAATAASVTHPVARLCDRGSYAPIRHQSIDSLTLPYLTLPYLTLPYLTLPSLAFPCLPLPSLAFPCLPLPSLALP